LSADVALEAPPPRLPPTHVVMSAAQLRVLLAIIEDASNALTSSDDAKQYDVVVRQLDAGGQVLRLFLDGQLPAGAGSARA
jgi:hypothetical protein